jgi:hypothetical protein
MEKLDLVYRISTEDFLVEYPLEIEIQGDILFIYPEGFGIPIGKLPLKHVLSTRPSINVPWAHSDVYHKANEDKDLYYCRKMLLQGKYEDELRSMMSLPDLEDYRVMASLETESPLVTSVVISSDINNLNGGKPIVYEDITVGDEIRFPGGADVRLSVRIFDQDSDLPYEIVLEKADVVMKVYSLAPDIDGVGSLDINQTVKADYFIDIAEKKETISNNLIRNLGLDQETGSIPDIVDSILDFSMDGLLPVPKQFANVPESVKSLLPKLN